MKLKEGFLLRQVGDNHIVVPVGAQVMDFRCIITLNETGALMWEKLKNDCTQADLVATLLDEYDVTEEIATSDVAAFIDTLVEKKLLDE